MLLELFRSLADGFPALNVFNYLTLRAVLAALTSMGIGFALGPWMIARLKNLHFGQAVRTAGQYRGEGKLTTWLCGIAKNVLRTYQRRHPVEEELDETAAAPGSPDEAFLARESQLELLRKMQTLGNDAREVMYLRIFGALSFRDIGEILSRTENWARVTYYRGREALRKELEKDDEK